MDWHPSPRKVRQFALCLATLLLLAAWFAPAAGWFRWAALAAGFVVLCSWIWPASVRPLYVALLLLALPIGLVVGEVALVTVWASVFVTMGYLFRWMKRDALQRSLDRQAVSYWEASPPEPKKRSYLRRY